MDSKVISARTWGVIAFGLIASAGSMVLVRMGAGDSEAMTALVANMGSLLTDGLAAALALWAAFQFGSHESPRKQWLFIGAGMLVYLIGDANWTYYEAVLRTEIPFPGPPDLFYLALFPLTAAGLVLAFKSFSAILHQRKPLVVASVITLVVMAALWLPVFKPALADTGTTGLARILGLLYPLADLWLLFFPALALSILLSRLAGGMFSWPWWLVVVGCVLFAFADTMFLITTNAGTYASGSYLDLGWWLGCTAIAVGASLAVDVQKSKRFRV